MSILCPTDWPVSTTLRQRDPLDLQDRLSVMLLDDCGFDRQRGLRLLARTGLALDTRAVATPAGLNANLAASPADVYLLDLCLGLWSGADIARALWRRTEGHAGIVLISGHAEPAGLSENVMDVFVSKSDMTAGHLRSAVLIARAAARARASAPSGHAPQVPAFH